ncbi:MAG: OmpH family outer membrane protein [Candidatus Sericytochromatia bacterium]|nr:OmpH family outer membrane protein [Candidatus Sericytochromatia bacterium]
MRSPLLAGLTGAAIAFSVALLQPVRASVPAGVVNLQELLRSYPEYKAADQQVKDAEVNYQKALMERMKKLEAARTKGSTPAQLQAMQKQFEAEIKPIQTRGVTLYKNLQDKLRGQIEKAIAEVAKAKGVDVIYDKQAVLYGGNDLTGAVSAKLKR